MQTTQNSNKTGAGILPRAFEWNIGQLARVSMSEVKAHCDLPPYLALVKRAIKNGDGFVRLNYVTPLDMAGISGNEFDAILGSVEVPHEALIF